jgi:hypothetical protein
MPYINSNPHYLNHTDTDITACPQVFSSGGTCTLLPSFLGVHPNFWGYKENELHFLHARSCTILIKYVLRCLYIEDDNRFIFLTEIKNVGKPETDIDV